MSKNSIKRGDNTTNTLLLIAEVFLLKRNKQKITQTTTSQCPKKQSISIQTRCLEEKNSPIAEQKETYRHIKRGP